MWFCLFMQYHNILLSLNAEIQKAFLTHFFPSDVTHDAFQPYNLLSCRETEIGIFHVPLWRRLPLITNDMLHLVLPLSGGIDLHSCLWLWLRQVCVCVCLCNSINLVSFTPPAIIYTSQAWYLSQMYRMFVVAHGGVFYSSSRLICAVSVAERNVDDCVWKQTCLVLTLVCTCAHSIESDSPVSSTPLPWNTLAPSDFFRADAGLKGWLLWVADELLIFCTFCAFCLSPLLSNWPQKLHLQLMLAAV